MKTALTVLTTCLVLLTVGTLTLLIGLNHQSRELARVNQRLLLELQESEDTVATLVGEKTAATETVTGLEAREKELRRRLASLEEADKKAAEVVPQPYRVRAFLGQDNVGGAWIIPHNVTRDTGSGRYVYEPLLVIDTSARKYFTEYRTNVVEREVYTTEVHDNYYPYYVAYGRNRGPHRPGGEPGTPPQPALSTSGESPTPDARARVFAPPMSIVNSRPQVLGTPATSPINAQVFAP